MVKKIKILHLSDKNLPDSRIEKMAYLSKKNDHETHFGGTHFKSFALGDSPFDQLHQVSWNRYARLGWPPYFPSVKKKLMKVVDEVKPDVIHAHEIFSAKIASELGYPFVFDDHERVSLEKKSDVEVSRKTDLEWYIRKYQSLKWGRWETKVSQKAPVITVSEKMADDYRENGSKVFVIQNYPSIEEVSNFNPATKVEKISSVYVGNIGRDYRPYRNLKKAIDFFEESNYQLVILGKYSLGERKNIKPLGYVPHLSMYKTISKYHIGLLPWEKHWFHEYASPNKPYIYAHAGLVVIVTSTLKGVIESFKGQCRTFDKYSGLLIHLDELAQDREKAEEEGERNMNFARENLIIENFEDKLNEAYRCA